MDDLTKLWMRHTRDSDPQAREALILHFAPLVKYVVGRLGIKLPRSLEDGDLISYGLIGLMEAVDRFDLSQKVKFETFAIPRIRGQIIDSLRSLDLLPRSTYRHIKEIAKAIAQLSQSLGRTPTDAEVAKHLGLDLSEYHVWLRDANCIILSLDRPLTLSDGEQFTLYDALEDDSMPTPAEHIDEQELKAQLIIAIGELPEREQLLVSLYYNDQLTMKEIGQILGVSESRVSQMHAKTVFTLHGLIQKNIEPKPAVYKRRKTYASIYAAAN